MSISVTSLRLPSNLPFPIKIQRLHLLPEDSIEKTNKLLTYSYFIINSEGEREKQVRVWESPVNGKLIKWLTREGDYLKNSSDPVIHIEEPCTHDVQLHGLCALCGKDLTTADYTGFSDTSRAAISMSHDLGGLTVSLDEAQRLEQQTTTRLLSTKKLSLIVDLDQTIVHATVDPTVGEWLEDKSNPNHSALVGTGKFKLGEEFNGGDEDEGCWYYVKMRPGLNEFLKNISDLYEMHVYTMGTRAYASAVCKIIDPDGGLFGGRILSRDESGSMTRKSLQRLFPCDTSMVVIIDDRADVWDGSPNLVKVIPYEFFVGIGDINAAFLPKKKDLLPPPIAPPLIDLPSSDLDPSSPSTSTGTTSTIPVLEVEAAIMSPSFSTLPLPENPNPVTPLDISVLSAVPSPFTTDSTIISPPLLEAEASTAQTIQDQIESRPLSHRSSVISLNNNKKNENDESIESGSQSSNSSSVAGDLEVGSDGVVQASSSAIEGIVEEDEEDEMMNMAVLRDDDRELDRLFKILTAVHVEFFREHQHRDPDVKEIIPNMKKAVLKGVSLVFSGLIALGVKSQDSEFWKLATTFGAECTTDLRNWTTHVVANQNGTEKVYKARKRLNIKVVSAPWLLDSIAHWMKLPELHYLIPGPPSTSDSTPPSPPNSSNTNFLNIANEEIDSSLSSNSIENERYEFEQEEEETPIQSQTGSQIGTDDLDNDIKGMNWDDANQEIDDFLNETDDEGNLTNQDGNESDESVRSNDSIGSMKNRKNGKKRERDLESGGEEDDYEEEGINPSTKGPASTSTSIKNSTSTTTASSIIPGSPLQKRVKTAISRKSKLKNSYPIDSSTIDDDTSLPSSSQDLKDVEGSSVLDSDDDAFFANMANELESGWD